MRTNYTIAEDISYTVKVFEGGTYKEIPIERNSKWNKLRNEIIKQNPFCSICKNNKNLQVHHIEPFHLWPELELEKSNLCILCIKCHLEWGHLQDWKSYNIEIVKDIVRINKRPYTRESN